MLLILAKWIPGVKSWSSRAPIIQSHLSGDLESWPTLFLSLGSEPVWKPELFVRPLNRLTFNTLLLFYVIPVVCSDGWIRNGSSCYYVYADTSKRLSFWNAKQWCKDHESSSLTTVFNEGENHFLDYLINETHLRPNETFYIGLRFRDGSWKWVTNQPFNYTNWFRGQEPAPAQGTGNCIYYNHVHRWQLEEKCVTKKLFICKTQPKQPQSQPTGISISHVAPSLETEGQIVGQEEVKTSNFANKLVLSCKLTRYDFLLTHPPAPASPRMHSTRFEL